MVGKFRRILDSTATLPIIRDEDCTVDCGVDVDGFQELIDGVKSSLNLFANRILVLKLPVLGQEMDS